MSRDAFESWFARNHPWDWWTKEMGAPIPTHARWLVSDFARRAYQEGRRDGIEEAAKEAEKLSPGQNYVWRDMCLGLADLLRALLSTPKEPSK